MSEQSFDVDMTFLRGTHTSYIALSWLPTYLEQRWKISGARTNLAMVPFVMVRMPTVVRFSNELVCVEAARTSVCASLRMRFFLLNTHVTAF